MKLPSSVERVPRNTSQKVNEEIRDRTRKSIEYYKDRSEWEINERLKELDREWDIERAIEANAASFSLAGLVLGATVSRRFMVIPFLIGGFLLQHSLQGWCPPVPFLRRLGFRTTQEIEEERYALKALKGDFDNVLEQKANLSRLFESITH